MSARGRTLGAISLVASSSGRRYDESELEFAEALAGRVALAVDNTRLYQEVREADRRKGEWIAMLAHELRNPLAPLLTGVHILRCNAADRPAVEQSATMMERQLRRLARLVDDLLDASRVGRGKIQLRRERLDLARLVRTTVADYLPALTEAGLTLTVQAPETPAWVVGDAAEAGAGAVATCWTTRSQVHRPQRPRRCRCCRRAGVRSGAANWTRPAGVQLPDTGMGIEPEAAAAAVPAVQPGRPQPAPHARRPPADLGALVLGLTRSARRAACGR